MADLKLFASSHSRFNRSVYFEFLDGATELTECVKSHFLQPSFNIYTCAESVLLNAFRGRCEFGQKLLTVGAYHFGDDIDEIRLKIQRFDDTTIRLFDDSTFRPYQHSTTGRFDGITIRQFEHHHSTI